MMICTIKQAHQLGSSMNVGTLLTHNAALVRDTINKNVWRSSRGKVFEKHGIKRTAQ